MNTIEINGRTLQYERRSSAFTNETVFYTDEAIKSRKWFNIFRPRCLFVIYQDCETPHLSKSWWKDEITRQLERVDKENKRLEELKRGELI